MIITNVTITDNEGREVKLYLPGIGLDTVAQAIEDAWLKVYAKTNKPNKTLPRDSKAWDIGDNDGAGHKTD